MSSGSATPNSNSYSTSSTPANLSSKKKPAKVTPKKTTPSRKNGRAGPRPFTASMQDKQARNKDKYSSSDESDETWASPNGRNAYKDTWEQTQKRREAAVILDNPELLMMHAQARFDSIPGTRHYFTKLLCGYLSEDEPYSQTEAEEKHQRARQERQERARSKDHELLQRRWLHDANGDEGDDSGAGGDEDMADLL